MFRQMLMASAARVLRDPREPAEGAPGDFDPLNDFIDDDAGDDFEDDDQGGFDDDDGDDAGGDDDNDDDDDEPPARRAKPKSRAAARLEKLASENAEMKRRLDALTTAQPQAQPGPTQAELDRQEAQSLAAMTAEQRVQYHIDKSNRLNEQRFNLLQFQHADTADKAAFDALCARKPALAKLASKVESTLVDMRKGGNTAPRKTIAAWLIGEQAIEGRSNAPRQRQQAAANRDRQEARPTGGRSDARPSSGKSTDRDARRKRLEGQNI